MTRTEQAAFRRLDKRRESLFRALCIISAWISSPWCAHSAEELVATIAKHTTSAIQEERDAAERESARQGGGQ